MWNKMMIHLQQNTFCKGSLKGQFLEPYHSQLNITDLPTVVQYSYWHIFADLPNKYRILKYQKPDCLYSRFNYSTYTSLNIDVEQIMFI